MRIYGDYTFLLDKLNVWNNSQVRVSKNGTKIVEFAERFMEQQRAASKDKVSISKEGLDYIVDQLPDLGSSEGKSQKPEDKVLAKTSGDGLSLMDGLCRTYILQRLDTTSESGVSGRLYNEMAGRYKENLQAQGDQSLSSHAQSLAMAHLAIREKIEEGYASGTREVWIMDTSTGDDFSGVEFDIDGQPVRYRKMTMEEELEAVEKTFGELVQNVSRHMASELIKREQVTVEETGTYNGTEVINEYEKGFWDLDKKASDLLDELKKLIKEIEEEEARKKKAKEMTLGDRLAAEQSAYGVEIAARGKQQSQYANYRKMSQMEAEARTLLGYIKA